jgi:hypothetical protein
VFAVRVSPGGPTATPDAPPASDNAPATPNAVKAFVRPLCFEFLRFEFRRFEFCLPCDMVEDLPFTDAFPAQGGYAHATTWARFRRVFARSQKNVLGPDYWNAYCFTCGLLVGVNFEPLWVRFTVIM